MKGLKTKNWPGKGSETLVQERSALYQRWLCSRSVSAPHLLSLSSASSAGRHQQQQQQLPAARSGMLELYSLPAGNAGWECRCAEAQRSGISGPGHNH